MNLLRCEKIFCHYRTKDSPHTFVKRLRDPLQRRNQEFELLFQKIERIMKRGNLKAVYEKKQGKVKRYDLLVDMIALLKIDVYTYLIACENP